jgi:hypothetical protein
MTEVIPKNGAPLDPASLYALVHGVTQSGGKHARPQEPARQPTVDRYEGPATLYTMRHRPPDCAVDLAALHKWRAMALTAQGIDPEKLKREKKHARALQSSTAPESLQSARAELRRRLRKQLERKSRHARGTSKIKALVRDLRINLLASAWPERYLPNRHSQHKVQGTEHWVEQLRSWDTAIGI